MLLVEAYLEGTKEVCFFLLIMKKKKNDHIH